MTTATTVIGLAPVFLDTGRSSDVMQPMAILIGLESRAADNGQIAVCRDAQAQFLKSHLAWWVPSFARLLLKENPDGFHVEVGKFLSALLPAERALLGVSACHQPAGPSPLERPEECEGCLVQSL